MTPNPSMGGGWGVGGVQNIAGVKDKRYTGHVS